MVIDRAAFRFFKYYFRDKLFRHIEDKFRFQYHYIEKDINYANATPYVIEFINLAFPHLFESYIVD